ncbi:MAG: lysine transporter LysE [Rhodospirillaceae bacterium]|nr:lysine transporter LysE [Rhodospirillaceae bacterium]|tara:strand:+ start:6137 stop:6799 length:663 start_codon:yes stop_codon:yes gene_type:complete
MEALLFFFKGIAAGFIVAIPVGPVAMLCIRRTLARNVMAGYATGLGAAIADTLYAIVAAYGISFIADILFNNDFWFRIVGGIILCLMAVRMIFGTPRESKTQDTDKPFGDFASALVITGTNPITVIAFGVIFTSIGVATAGQRYEWAEALIAGVFVGSSAWWAFLAGIAAICRRSVGTISLTWINRVSAAVILGCGVLILLAAIAPESQFGTLIAFPEPS